MIDFVQLSAFHFLRPAWLILLIPIVLAAIFARGAQKPASNWSKLIADHLLPSLTVPGGLQSWYNPINIGMLLLALSVLLMSGPSWQRQAVPFLQDKAVLVIAIDLSNTMNQTDVQPSRLERAKQKVVDLVALRGNARTGLIAYSGSAHQVLPLSNDPDIMRQFLAAIDSSMMPTQGKLPEKLIPLAKQMLADADAPGTLLIIGDGVSSETLNKFQTFFDGAPFQLIVLGVGLTQLDDSAAADKRFGGAHLALQEDALKSLAGMASGQYVDLQSDKSDVQKINRLVDQHLLLASQSDIPWQDAGYYLLYPICLIFLLWFRRGWTLNWCLALYFVCAVEMSPRLMAQEMTAELNSKESVNMPPAKLDTARALETLANGFFDLWFTPDQQGRYYFDQRDYQRAAQRFRDPLWQGVAFYYAENFNAAAEIFRQVDGPVGKFNLANALAQGQNYVQAVNVYTQLLTEDPTHASADKNRKFVQQIIDDINRMSASQQAEPGKATRELGDAPQRADGADREDIASDKIEQVGADQLLADEQVYAMWMRQVQADPKRFLRAKFQLQRRASDDD